MRDSSQIRHEDHPRIRGEHAPSDPSGIADKGSSPHTRGALVTCISDARRAWIIPAYAGSTEPPRGADVGSGDHPRIRGEHSWLVLIQDRRRWIIPAYAGSTLQGSSRHPRWERIIPAYAGSTGCCGSSRIGITDHPRIRGEHIFITSLQCLLHWIIPAYAGSTAPTDLEGLVGQGSSPHTRGALSEIDRTIDINRIIPAYAGSTIPAAARRWPSTDHPRIRGEHGHRPGLPPILAGSSPHTRGARGRGGRRRARAGIIPAYAGSTRFIEDDSEEDEDHPRIRGEHDVICMGWATGPGSSPHTRGARPNTGAWAMRSTDHPRIRGEHFSSSLALGGCPGSSPHTRGAPMPLFLFIGVIRIIPAYAGSTLRRTLTQAMPRDHPRIRGEHGDVGHECLEGVGSSPHTRGAPVDVALADLKGRIIPAYAGST